MASDLAIRHSPSAVGHTEGHISERRLAYTVSEAIVETPEGAVKAGRLHFTAESEKSVRDTLADAGLPSYRTGRAECIEWLNLCASERSARCGIVE